MTKRVLLFFVGGFLLILLAGTWAGAQPMTVGAAGVSMAGPQVFTYADSNGKGRRYVPPPADFRRKAPATAAIIVNFIGTWNPQAQAAFQYAADIWATQIVSNVPIVVEARWSALPSGVLGSAGATTVYRDFPGAPQANTWYPVAMANAISGSDLNSSTAEISAQFSSAFSNWYFGTDGQPGSNQYDFVTVVLHELGHGLGFVGSMRVDNGDSADGVECTGVSGIGCWGFGTPAYPMIYDRFTQNGSGTALLAFPNNSNQLTVQLTGGNIFFNDNGQLYELYAPVAWAAGSSYSHLGESYNTTPNALMTFSVSNGEAIHDPGDVTRSIFNRMSARVYVATLTPTPVPSPTPIASLTPTPLPSPTPLPTQYSFLPLVLLNSAATPVPTPLPSGDWLGYLNGLRTIGGLPAVGENASWSNGCTLHARYMVKTDTITHSEIPTSTWYTLDGDTAAKNSNLAVSADVNVIDTSALDMWMVSPFHGVALIDPKLSSVGFGSYREAIGTWQMGACLDVVRGQGGVPADVTFPVMWPADGERLVYAVSDIDEMPDPLAACSGYTRPVGAPIYLLLGPGWSVTPNVTASSLKQGNTDLAHCAFDSATYSNPDAVQQDYGRAILNARDAVVLLPRDPLTPGARYDVSITVNGQTYTWYFTVQSGAVLRTTKSQAVPSRVR
ncbi:MAG: hypothetical protein Fur0018_01220 [Anaerolineales bacterium]